jgi:uncharacterized protein (TIGR00369 family)
LSNRAAPAQDLAADVSARYPAGMDASLERDERCFCCGKNNEHGLHLAVSYPAKGTAEATFAIPERFSGWREMTHGGLLSMVLDELMAHACISAGVRAVTAELTVRFVKPVAIGERVRVMGRVAQERGRLVATEGRIEGPDGAAIAQATARFLRR